MSLGRRTFLKAVGVTAVVGPYAHAALAQPAGFAPQPGPARTFELTTRVELADTAGGARVWVPAPSRDFGDWFSAHGTTFSGNPAEARLRADPHSGARFVEARWDGQPNAVLEVVSRVSTRDRAVDPARAGGAAPLAPAERARYLRATPSMPTGGIVKATSDSIVQAAGARSDLEKVRAIYDWVVLNTYRNPTTLGCGRGDIGRMLRTGDLGGKCADINGLFVALVRAQGVPARDLYGVRLAASRFGYRSLGANSPTVTKAQHCRAEVHLEGVGWFPVDPADVRKVVLEEPPGNLRLDSDKVAAAKAALFGAWETNWLPYNASQEVRIADGQAALPFLMYPQGEAGGRKFNCLEPESFRYTITAREVAA